MKNNSGMPEYDTLCETVTDTVTSVIRFLPDYSLYEAADNPALLELDTSNLENLKTFSEKHSYDEVLFGKLVRNEQEKLQFLLQIYDLGEHDIIVEQEAVAETLLDVFDTADVMTLDLLGQITDVNIGFGTIELIKAEGSGNYEVYLDGKTIRNPKKNFDKVLNGEYLLEIYQDRLLGDTVIHTSRVYVNEFQTSTVRFSIPKATEEELRFILVRNSEMLETASDPDNLDRFLAEIADFQELTKDIDYDPELVELKDTIIDELGDRAAFLLEETMEKADKTYYAEDPDFEQASQIYSRITALVNNSFSYSFADPEGTAGISSPKEVLYAAGDIIYLLDGADTPRLSSFGPDTVFIAERELIDWDGTSGNLSLAADPDGNCLVFAAGTAAVHRYTAELTDPIRLTVPDYSADPDDTLSVAVSRENTVYLVGNRQVLVFEYAIGNETTVERDNVIEQNLKNALEPYGDTPLADVFFDDSNVLHLFFPSSGEVLQCTSLGEVITSVEFPGISADSDIAVDGLGYYYFTMPEEHRVLKYSPKGEFISEFGSFGDGEGEFSRPEGIAVSGEGTVYIAEAGNKRLQVLTLTAPPLLLPEVAQYGEQFTRRKQSSEEAVEKISAVQTDGTFWKATLDFGVPAAIMGSSFALAFVDGILYRNSMNNFAEYQNSTDLEDVEEFRSRAALNWAFSRVSLYAGYAAMGAGSYWLASSIGSSIDAKVQQKRTVEYLQSFDMDKEYDVDEGKFRSLQTANILGFTTGVLPPLLGGTAALVLSFIPQVNPQISRVAAAGCIAIPPIFAHVYAGQISWGNFVNGLIADAMAITAFLLAKDVSKSVYFDSIEDPAERGERYYNSTMEYALSDYYLFGALVFRFVAGWNDFRRGWKRANEYNTYEAVTERPSPLSFRAGPYFDENGSPGLAFTLQF